MTVKTGILLGTCLVLSFLLVAEDTNAAKQKARSIEDIAAIEQAAERETTLRDRVGGLDTLEGRLVFLEDAAKHESLKQQASKIMIELLMLSGRTEEAEKHLDSAGLKRSDIADRLALTHGRLSLDAGEAETLKADHESIETLSREVPGSPEYFASRRGMILSAGLMFSYYKDAAEVEAPAATSKPESDRSVMIQLGAFTKQANAMSHLDYLGERGVDAEIISQKNPDGSLLFKTVVTDVSQTDVQKEIIRLKEKGIEGFILH